MYPSLYFFIKGKLSLSTQGSLENCRGNKSHVPYFYQNTYILYP